MEAPLHRFCRAKPVQTHWPFFSRIRAHSHRPMIWYPSGPGHSPPGGRMKQPRGIGSEEVTSPQLTSPSQGFWLGWTFSDCSAQPAYQSWASLPALVCFGWWKAPASYQITLSFSRRLLLWDTKEWAKAKARMWALMMWACLSLSFLSCKTDENATCYGRLVGGSNKLFKIAWLVVDT